MTGQICFSIEAPEIQIFLVTLLSFSMKRFEPYVVEGCPDDRHEERLCSCRLYKSCCGVVQCVSKRCVAGHLVGQTCHMQKYRFLVF